MNAVDTQLVTADPADWPVAPGWQPLVGEFFASARGQALRAFLQARLEAGATIFPPRPLRALELTPPEEVRVVILGQDPYHGRGQAEGLAFSVAPGVRLPPSLQNIFKEMQRDLGTPFPPFPDPGGSLVKWAKNGVLLLNTCLTVEEGQPASHSGKGWELLTDAVSATSRKAAARWCSCSGVATRSPSAPSSRATAGTSCSRPTTPRHCPRCARPCPSSAAGISARRAPSASNTGTDPGACAAGPVPRRVEARAPIASRAA